MNRTLIAMIGALMLAVGFASPSLAQATRTWVSGVGDDANPCSRTAPCRTFAGSISKTAAGGEISALDPGSFGAVTITKSITIDGAGVLAGISNAGTNGITVIAQLTTDVVVLRNLSINGSGTGLDGIKYASGAQLVVDNVSVVNVTQNGIDVSHSSVGHLVVRNSTFTGAAAGVKINSGTVSASLSHVSIQATTVGVDAVTGSVDIDNSVIAQNSGYGLLAEGGVIDIDSSVLSGNNVALQAQTGSTIRISNSDLYNNETGFGCGGGTLASAQNNRKGGNVGGTVPVCVPNAVIVLQ
jgi:hypothetical protein